MKNPYGYFDKTAKEYVITRPDTPLPWLNYLGSDDFFGLCTNTGGGYTFYKDARMRRLTRYRYNDLPMDNGGRYLYVKDGDTLWNPGWKPVRTGLDAYECRHGLGYTRIRGKKLDLEVELLFFIVPGENIEIWRTRVKNCSEKTKIITLFSFAEFCFYDALNDMTNLQRTYNTGEVEIEGSVIYHVTEYRERRDHYTAFGCTRNIDGFDTSRESFVGIHNGLHDPLVPLSGKAKNSKVFGWNPIGSHQINLELQPGEEQVFSFFLAYIEQPQSEKFEQETTVNKTTTRKILETYSNPSRIDAAFLEMKNRWDVLFSGFQVQCPHENTNLIVNTWNQYQNMATFNLSRSATLFDTGIGRGMGFRDSSQDLLGFVHMVPEKARQRILDLAATQMSDGSCYHQYQPLTKKGNADIGGGFNDDHLWLVIAICAYLKETGDRSILEEKVGYADLPGSRETLFHHLDISVNYTLNNLGPHDLPLIGHADWNDCLNLNCFSTDPNESFQTAGDVEGSIAESVMIAGLFLYTMMELESLYDWLGDQQRKGDVATHYQKMLTAIEEHTWDGEWYLRAFDAGGNPIGSSQNREGQIFIESQAWCLLGGAGVDTQRAEKVLDQIHRRLYTPHGILLHQPAYTRYYPELGEISSYPPGHKENAGVFSHNNTWIHLALCKYGMGERALEYYDSICPASKEDDIERYKTEPYVYAQVIAGRDAKTAGEGKNSWLTGTAAWSFVAATQGILGIQPEYEGLRIDPCVPKAWKEFEVTRRFRGTEYRIKVLNRSGVNKGVRSVEVDGEKTEGNLVPLFKEGQVVEVSVIM